MPKVLAGSPDWQSIPAVPELQLQWAGSTAGSVQTGLPAPSWQQVLGQQVVPHSGEPAGHDAVHVPKMQTSPPVQGVPLVAGGPEVHPQYQGSLAESAQ
jgi:hypothetical protein